MHTILIVEDNKELRENTAELLQLAGFKVITAADGNEGLLLTLEQNPDLILCDLVMPIAGGKELLLNKTKDRRISEIPFVFFSAGTASFQQKNGYVPDAYLSKPFTYEQLLNTVSRFVKPN